MSSNLTKRKRRKTRKCLDEIRKRSRRLIVSNNTAEEVHENQINTTNNIKPIKSHTSRLTLAMFPKAIQSETITRPILAKMSKKLSLNLDDIVGNKSEIVRNHVTKVKKTNIHSPNETMNDDQNIILGEHNSENINSTDTSGSYVLFSPNNSRNSHTDTDNAEVSQYHIQELYEDFLSDASSYMKANASEALLKDYNLDKVRNKLRELYIKYKECEEKMEPLNQIKSNFKIEDSIVQNPIDYIRQKCTGSTKLQGHTACYSHKFSESPSSSEGSPQSTPANLISPKSTKYETPEYIFFPHKLN